MRNLQANLKTLQRVPILLIDNGSAVAAYFLSILHKQMKAVDVNLDNMPIPEVYDKVLGLDDDSLPIFYLPKSYEDDDLWNLVHFMLKRESCSCNRRTIEFEKLRYVIVAKGSSIADIDSDVCPPSLGVWIYVPEQLEKLKILFNNAVGMDPSRLIKTYQMIEGHWVSSSDSKSVVWEMAKEAGVERKPEWNIRIFVNKLMEKIE